MSKRYEIEMLDSWVPEWCEGGACNKCYEMNNRKCPLAKTLVEAKDTTELLAALEAAAVALSYVPEAAPVLKDVRAAIAKAKGE